MGDAQVLPRRVLLGITGGIAAYKTPHLVRALVKAGAEVQVVLTPDAHEFVSPLVLSTLSRRPALTRLVEHAEEATIWNDHVHLARWADVMLVAPATANTLAKMALGLCDNLLLACWLSRQCPVFVAPAMDLEMYRGPAVRGNIAALQAQGVRTIGPEQGELASGLVGEGRMTEPEEILAQLAGALTADSPWHGRRLLITAGPTHEAIDPVRFIGNSSSGKMGFALAEEAAARGARVELIAGPVSLSTDHPGIHRTNVVSAAEMAQVAKEKFPLCHLAIMSAAVADWRPARVAAAKLKKKDSLPAMELEPTEDILAWMGAHKALGQRLVGFALETTNEKANAQEKLRRKNLDLIVLNSLNDAGAGFGHDTNKVTLIDGTNAHELPLMSKADVARAILDQAEKLMPHAK